MDLIRNSRISSLHTIISVVFISFLVFHQKCCASPQLDTNNYHLYNSAPIIEPISEDVTIDMNSNYKLRCESDKPIKWFYYDYESYPIDHKIAKYSTQNPIRPFGIELTLLNLTVYNVRYYFCVHNDIDIVETSYDTEMEEYEREGFAAKIYVFVNDLDNLLVQHVVPLITVEEGKNATIPCKPTHKGIEVKLESSNREEPFYEYEIYDIKIGYRLVNLSGNGMILLSCSATNSTSNNNDYYLFIQPLPNIQDIRIVEQPFNGHVISGTAFNLTCQITRDISTLFSTTWSHPNMVQIKQEKRWIESGNIIDETGTIVKKKLTILNTKKSIDSGKYKCTVDDSEIKRNQFATIKVLDENEHYIDLYEEKNVDKLTVNASKRINMVVKYIGHPHPTIVWKRPDQTVIGPNDNSYEIQVEDSKTILTIKSPQFKNSGYYTVVAANEYLEKEYKFLLQVRDKPTLYMDDIYYEMIGNEIKIKCQCDAYPEPIISWSFTPCTINPKWPNCNLRKAIGFNETQSIRIKKTGIHQIYELNFTPTEPGIIQCRAVNKVNTTIREAEIRIGDIEEPISISSTHLGLRIATDDIVKLTCSALAYNYSDNLNWYLNEVLIEPDESIQIAMKTTKFSYQKTLTFNNIHFNNSGNYECRVHSTVDDETTENKFINIEVHSPQPPHIYEDNNYQEIIYKEMGRLAELQCKADGLPKPTVTWLKDGAQLNMSSDNIEFADDNHTLIIKVVRPNDSEGIYKCTIQNRLGSVERTFELQISDYEAGFNSGWIIFISIVILILLLFIIFLCIRVYKDLKIRKQLKAIGIENFEKGAVEHINPALSLDEQAELLPYDKRFEFPREKLHLGKQLGAGAFGIVHMAQAVGIITDEKESTVAVKMVKKTADNEVVRALVSELKIMVHLGQHLNVVNLLGAVTKNIAKREVMVIVEFCRYGNVQNFLLKNRKNFINQINPQNDLIDPNIISNDKRFSNDFEFNSQGLRYVNFAFSNQSYNNNSNSKSDGDPRPGTRAGRPNSSGYIRQSNLYYGGVDSAMTQQTLIHSVPESEEILSNSSSQPAWKSDSSDYMEITTSHLVSWAFQVARGMEYLSSRKVLHGDLAARNILLCEDNVVKICDFGLARSMYKNDNYKKDKDARLPVKWLALESLGDRIFSTRSDVWSFGIVLWEFFSLSKVPYPGMEADQSLYERLKDGYRMEKPMYANKELYEIMLECWRTNPESRPLFDELGRRFAKLLEEEVTNHYLDLNEHYLRVNAEYEKTDQIDYLAMMGSPDNMAPAPPRYVNGMITTIPEIKIDNADNYLQMNPKSDAVIFSPRTTDSDYIEDNHFNFGPPHSPTTSNNTDSPIVKNRNKNNAGIPEEIPMLTRQSQSDSDAETIPDLRKKGNSPPQSNVRMQINDLERKHTGTNDAFTNPSYLILQNVNEKKK